jgi:hypothetical protein
VLGTSVYKGVKLERQGSSVGTQVFHFFLSLHHPNNRLENISISYLPLLNLVAEKTILRYNKTLEEHVLPPAPQAVVI